MVIYVDVLIVVNLLVNYFLILATINFLRKKVKLWRILLASFAGSVFSLYIFLPQINLIFEIIIKIVLCMLISAISINIKPYKQFLKFSGVLFFVTCAYAGVMIVFWKLFKPDGIIINNSVVYFNISPVYLVVFSCVSYILFLILFKIFSRNNPCAAECEIAVFYKNNKAQFKAIIDTGNSVCDIFGKSEIIIVDKSVLDSLFNKYDEDVKCRYRAIPYNSITASGILDGYRCDSGYVVANNKKILLKEPIIAASITEIKDDYSGIVNPQILN